MENEKDIIPGQSEKLTIEELRSFPGCENYSDEEAKEIITTLYQLAIILFDTADRKK